LPLKVVFRQRRSVEEKVTANTAAVKKNLQLKQQENAGGTIGGEKVI
jgi:hypothetical protein